MTPDTTVVTQTRPVTPERWREFFDFVRDVRQLQRLYRRTIDPRVRREMEAWEEKLDADMGWLAADLAAEEAAAEAVLVDTSMLDATGKGGAL